ncbi:MAG: alpha/beta hydrolase [Acidimicrobiaceae bacterium]|nr:alpha/beta fold hydrolase [Acidimicrobiaceae bacterium]MXW88187.1 alpha/beta hydrolase [Acidimicrobiaceae bacterium]MYE55996.1 alpha/beta hydrolase [Acidimicrobiaceae bacterium]MYE66058.1 alpha/beta hydrolase [Acidimicrobiaceae bacterium]
MQTARNGEIEVVYETFGSDLDPPLILLHGLGSSMLVWPEDMCAGFVDRGFFVLRMDHRDSGLSTVLPEGARYTLEDMAGDAMAVLDAAGCRRAVVCGYSLGGMVAQAAAVSFGDRVAGLVSISSHTGEPGVGDPTPEALAALTAPPAPTIEAQIEADLAGYRIWSNPEWRNEEAESQYLERSYRRAWHPGASQRQFKAAARSGSRAGALGALDVPALVVHGGIDTLIGPDAGRRTAEVIPGAQYLEIEGMGHELPPQVWAPIISAVTALSARIAW